MPLTIPLAQDKSLHGLTGTMGISAGRTTYGKGFGHKHNNDESSFNMLAYSNIIKNFQYGLESFKSNFSKD